MVHVYAKWLVKGNLEDIKAMVEEDEFYIQIFADDEDMDNFTFFPSEDDTTANIKPAKKGYYTVFLVGSFNPADYEGYDNTPVLSPSCMDGEIATEKKIHAYDPKTGRKTDEAYDWGTGRGSRG